MLKNTMIFSTAKGTALSTAEPTTNISILQTTASSFPVLFAQRKKQLGHLKKGSQIHKIRHKHTHKMRNKKRNQIEDMMTRV